MVSNKKGVKRKVQRVTQDDLFKVISDINLKGITIGQQVTSGNVYAERLVAQYVLYQQFPGEEKFKLLLVQAYKKYNKMLSNTVEGVE